MSMKNIGIIILSIFLSQARAGELYLQSQTTVTPVIELYTSEGCNSCPPAEAYLNKYVDHPRLWQGVIPMAFHVDYWDYLGWRDRYSSPDYSQRQRQYARILGMRTVYTPGLFYNGSEWRNWYWGRTPPTAEHEVGQLKVSVNGDRLEAMFDAMPSEGGLELHVAILGMGLVNEIRAGENRGRTSKHEFVVLGHEQVRSEGRRWQTQLPQVAVKAPRYALVVWVSRAGHPAPIQSVGAYLN
jgi:hypothetical protein